MKQRPLKDTLDLKEAADFLKISISCAHNMAARGELPGSKTARKWVFLRSELTAYLLSETRRQQHQRQIETDYGRRPRRSKCHSKAPSELLQLLDGSDTNSPAQKQINFILVSQVFY